MHLVFGQIFSICPLSGKIKVFGVTDKLQEGTYAYISDGSTIKFTPPWAPGYHGYGTSHNCALLATTTTSYSAQGQWIEFKCIEY